MDIRQHEMYEAFMYQFDYCMACGWYEGIIRQYFPMCKLDNAHVLGGASRKQKGKTDRRNLVRLCTLCHKLSHHEAIRNGTGEYIAHLDRHHLLWLKHHHDHDFYDIQFLNSISIQRMPLPERPPAFFGLEFKRWKPRIWEIIEEKNR